MIFLLDTNFLVSLGDTGHAMHSEALATIDWLDSQGHGCAIVPQVLYEYWVVATRPQEHNGLGMDVAKAKQAVTEWVAAFKFLLDEPGIFELWRNLVIVCQVKGKTAHDARLVAAMKLHGLTNLITFNSPDFVRFPDIQIFTPQQILTGTFAS